VKPSVCVHRLPGLKPAWLPKCLIVSTSTTRDQLMQALTSVDCDILILDLDDHDAINTIVAAVEVCGKLVVVGLTGSNDFDLIIKAQRAGCKQLSRKPIDPDDLRAAVLRAAQEIFGAKSTGHCTAVMGPTGGSGSTTLACHLAMEMANQAVGRTLLVDLDFDFGGVARAFDLSPKFTFSDLAEASSIDKGVLETTIVKVDDGPDILARPRNIADAHRVSGETVRETLRVAAESYGHVIMDLPRKLDEITGVGIEMCDRLLLVVQLTVPSVDNAARLLDTLSGEGIGRERVDLVINRFRKKVHSCTVEMVEKQLNLKSIGTIPSDYSSVNRALDAGVLLSPKSAVRTSIADLAQKLLGAAHARSRDSKLGLAKGVS